MIAVDTNVISALLRGDEKDLPSDELFVPYAVVAELQAGVAAGNNPPKNKTLIDTFLEDSHITTSPGLLPEVIPFYTQIYSYLRAQGTPVSPNDLWIAAECMSLSLALLTFDSDFQKIPQIILVETK